MMKTSHSVRFLATAIALAAALAGCSGQTAEDHETEATPQRIAALSPDVAETVAALGAGDRLVLIPDSQTHPSLTNHPDVMRAVGSTIAAHGPADPERILAANPDIAIVTPRHEGETDTSTLLAGSSVRMVTLPNTWQSVDEMLTDIIAIGDAIGSSRQATELASSIRDGMAEIRPVPAPARSVLILSNQAGRPMINAGKGFTQDLVTRAGGRNAADDAGLSRTGFADPEQVVRARPDVILLVDMLGLGRDSFAPILSNPAVRQLAAVRGDRILLLDGKHSQALGLQSTVDGLRRIRDRLGDTSDQR
ncbi:ABC transporter substrate-binding protein [Gordonia aurantiaca]|uniref:ABC transporter substrate-binding protein n=1 Tax=Gordonia sp. B21 TaxID=3151852 RepID=UPI0032668C25